VFWNGNGWWRFSGWRYLL